MLSTAILEGAVASTRSPRFTHWRMNSTTVVVLPVTPRLTNPWISFWLRRNRAEVNRTCARWAVDEGEVVGTQGEGDGLLLGVVEVRVEWCELEPIAEVTDEPGLAQAEQHLLEVVVVAASCGARCHLLPQG